MLQFYHIVTGLLFLFLLNRTVCFEDFLKVLFKHHRYVFSCYGLCWGTVCIWQPNRVCPAQQGIQWYGEPGLCSGQQEIQQHGNIRQSYGRKEAWTDPEKAAGCGDRVQSSSFLINKHTGKQGTKDWLTFSSFHDKPTRKWVFPKIEG